MVQPRYGNRLRLVAPLQGGGKPARHLNREYMRWYRGGGAHVPAKHGTRSKYKSCKCHDCRDANNHYSRARRGLPPRAGCKCAECNQFDETYGGLLP